MRKAINGLSILVQEDFEVDIFSGALFGFCNFRRKIVKFLYWDTNGFCLWVKRLERGRFKWPDSKEDILKISSRQLSWLLSGLEVKQRCSHKELFYKHLS
jgi:transposase